MAEIKKMFLDDGSYINYLDFCGKMIYQDGWFVYLRDNGDVCPLTRNDARMVEYSYGKYKVYEARKNAESSSYEGVRPFEDYGLSGPDFFNGVYKVDGLADSSLDVKIGDCLEIPQFIGGYKINTICEKSFCKQKIKKLILPESVRRIRKDAFSGCDELKEITFGGNVRVFQGVFGNCKYIDDEMMQKLGIGSGPFPVLVCREHRKEE